MRTRELSRRQRITDTVLKALGGLAAIYLLIGLVLRPSWYWPTLPEYEKSPRRLSESDIGKEDREYRTYLLDRVAHGEMSFEQAGCEDRGGDWDDENALCVREFLVLKSENTTQDVILGQRIEILAGKSNSHDLALLDANTAANAWLHNHPRDYRGAVGRAIGAVRVAGYLKGLIPEVVEELPQLTDGGFTRFISTSKIRPSN